MKKVPSKQAVKNTLPKNFKWESVKKVHLILNDFVKETRNSILVDTEKSDNLILAEKLYSKFSNPRFTNSAVDGWAVKGPFENKKYKIPTLPEIISAGYKKEILVPDGYAIKILTGAKLPKGTDTVILKENVKLHKKTISFYGSIKKGLNTRLKGEDIEKGQLLFDKGHLLRPQDMALLISSGLHQIRCKKKLRLALFSTGDEIFHLDKNLKLEEKSDMIFDVNRH